MRDQEMVLSTPVTVHDIHMTPQVIDAAAAAAVPKDEDDRVAFLFDVDGTLCESQQLVPMDMKELLREASRVVDVAIVSGSDETKVLRQFDVERKEQLGDFGIRYCMFENGVRSYDLVKDQTLHEGSILTYLGEARYQELVNFLLRELSEMVLPVKRDGMIETRRGNINVSPVGRRCSYPERIDFFHFDQKQKLRRKLADKVNARYGPDLYCSLGGQISVDICPTTWTKALVLNILDPKRHPLYHYAPTTAATIAASADATTAAATAATTAAATATSTAATTIGHAMETSGDSQAIPLTTPSGVHCAKRKRFVFFGDNCGPGGNDEPLYQKADVAYWVSNHVHCKKCVLQHLDMLKSIPQ